MWDKYQHICDLSKIKERWADVWVSLMVGVRLSEGRGVILCRSEWDFVLVEVMTEVRWWLIEVRQSAGFAIICSAAAVGVVLSKQHTEPRRLRCVQLMQRNGDLRFNNTFSRMYFKENWLFYNSEQIRGPLKPISRLFPGNLHEERTQKLALSL